MKVRYPLFAQDDETVNGDPFGNRLVTGVGDGAPFIVDAVTRYVDGVAVGVESNRLEESTMKLVHDAMDDYNAMEAFVSGIASIT